MARTAPTTFVTVRSEGGLLPPDLLARIVANDPELGGLTPTDYGAEKGEKLTEVAAQVWANCKIYWEAFKATRSRLGEGESGLTETREQWVLPLFRELGYGRLTYHAAAEIIDDRSYPISHRTGETEDAPPIHVVAFDQDLDRGEGKRTVAGGLRVSPQGLMQDYLNRTPHLWGIVTNGRQLRLLRDNESLTRAAYVEFNLEAMMEGGVYADFVLLFLLLHRSRLPQGQQDAADCWLEKWRLVAVQGGTRALDALREGVTTALKAVGQGLLEHPENDTLRERLVTGQLSVTDYYRQLLRLVYRLLFLLVAEERELLFSEEAVPRLRAIYHTNYSVSRLRERAERRRREDRHDDLWRSLQVTFGMMRDGCVALALAPLSGGLFNERSCPDLDGAQLANDALLAALRGLSLVTVKGIRRRVNYRDLNVEELGSVYESLLELHPALRREGSMPRFELVEGSERKTTGSYYTPPQLVAEVIKSALEPVIARALSEGRTPVEKRRRLLALKVCDPAAGSGHFLLAAARRIGREVARLDAGETEPDIETLRMAVREVIGHCIYGVDVNPLAVDLCRLALWIEGHLPARPLSFLDHRIKCGNSLIGATPEAVEAGLPDEAFTPLSGDDRAFASGIKRRNRTEGGGQTSFFSQLAVGELLGAEASEDEALAAMEIGDVQETDARTLREKEARYEVFRESEVYERKLFLADTWTAAFFWQLLPERPDPPTAASLRRLREGVDTLSPAQRAEIQRLAAGHHFFHWNLEFPDVFAEGGGFECVLGNPPWERLKLQEEEFFATRDPEIAAAPNKAARERLIKALTVRRLDESDKEHERRLILSEQFETARHAAEAQSKFVRLSGRFPLTGLGDVNTYALFAEHFRTITSHRGCAGIICPTGIATDDLTKLFFSDLIATNGLLSLFDFDNRGLFFPSVHADTQFCLLTLADNNTGQPVRLAFRCISVLDLSNLMKVFSLTSKDMISMNPNTKTCPIFRTSVDAKIVTEIFKRIPVLVNENLKLNDWGVSVRQGVFHFTNENRFFHSSDGPGLLVSYEGKMVAQYNHRYATYDDYGLRISSAEEKADPSFTVSPQYWVPADETAVRLAARGWVRDWLLAVRDIANATNERTTIASILPKCGTDLTLRIVFSDQPVNLIPLLLASLNCLVVDYIVRQKIIGKHLSDYIIRQLPILPPHWYNPADREFVVRRVLELVYTSSDLVPFARDLGYEGLPFIWDEARRAVLRAELDAYYAHLYGLTRKQLRYILDPHDLTDRELENILDSTEDPPDAPRTRDFPGETFRVLKEREMKEYGEYRTKRLVLEAWDRLHQTSAAIEVGDSAIRTVRGA